MFLPLSCTVKYGSAQEIGFKHFIFIDVQILVTVKYLLRIIWR